ncbi:MAG: hypothetical protein ABIH01_03720 [Candidatus Omnitrophota bacterium]
MDRLTKAKLKELEKFTDMWKKFHDIYRKSSNRKDVSTQDEKEFFEAKQIVERRYSSLLELLGKKPHPDPVEEILKVISVTTTSDKILTKIQADWVAASLLFNDWKKSLEGAPVSGGFFKKIFKGVTR